MLYILSRYVTYGVQFINSIFIAVYLGPVYLGVWGFIMLVVQYLNQINFGIAQSAQTIASINKHREKYVSKITGNASITVLILSCLWGIVFICNYLFNWNFGEKYSFSSYSLLVFIIAVFTYFNSLLSNILRVYGRITEVAISQSLLPLATLIVIFFYRKQDLVTALVWSYAITTVFSTCIFIMRMPIKIRFNLNIKLWKTIQKKGWFLFIYSSSFYLILISTRTFVSHYYTVREFGYFTFAFSLANVLILLLDSFSFLIWPKLLNRLANLNNSDSYKLILEIRKLYIASTHAMLHVGIFLFPFFLLIFPKYRQTQTAFCLVALTIVLFTNSFGYQGLIIARGKEKLIGRLSFFTLVLNITLCYVLVNYFKVDYDYVVLGTLFSYFIYILLINFFGRKILLLNTGIADFLKDVFPLNLFFPFIISFICVLAQLQPYYFIIPLAFYLVLNYKIIKEMESIIRKLLRNPNFFEI